MNFLKPFTAQWSSSLPLLVYGAGRFHVLYNTLTAVCVNKQFCVNKPAPVPLYEQCEETAWVEITTKADWVLNQPTEDIQVNTKIKETPTFTQVFPLFCKLPVGRSTADTQRSQW